MCVPENKPNGRPQYYVSECPATKRQFLVEHGRDNNLVELTMENAETIRRFFVAVDTPTGNARRKADLYDRLAAEYKRFGAEIASLHPGNRESVSGQQEDYQFQEYDNKKNEFLESLWDVISQHFDDQAEV